MSITLAAAACTRLPSSQSAPGVTPILPRPGGAWVLVLLNHRGDIVRSLTVRFSNQSVNTCTSGNWKSVEVLAERPARPSSFAGVPAYTLDGHQLLMDLSANVCDASYMLRGRLTELGWSGRHGPEHPFAGRDIGDFYAVPVEAPASDPAGERR